MLWTRQRESREPEKHKAVDGGRGETHTTNQSPICLSFPETVTISGVRGFCFNLLAKAEEIDQGAMKRARKDGDNGQSALLLGELEQPTVSPNAGSSEMSLKLTGVRVPKSLHIQAWLLMPNSTNG